MNRDVFKALTEKEPPKRKRPRVASVKVKGTGVPKEAEFIDIPVTFYVINDIITDSEARKAVNSIDGVWIEDINEGERAFEASEPIIFPANSTTSNNGFTINVKFDETAYDKLNSFKILIKDIVLHFKTEKNDEVIEAVQVYNYTPIHIV